MGEAGKVQSWRGDAEDAARLADIRASFEPPLASDSAAVRYAIKFLHSVRCLGILPTIGAGAQRLLGMNLSDGVVHAPAAQSSFPSEGKPGLVRMDLGDQADRAGHPQANINRRSAIPATAGSEYPRSRCAWGISFRGNRGLRVA
jgi:hypothetical protein